MLFVPDVYNSIYQKKIKRKSSRNPRRMIKISTSDGRWQGEWTCDYLLSLKDLRLQDLVEDEHKKDAQVFINLTIHKVTHTPLLTLLLLLLLFSFYNYFFVMNHLNVYFWWFYFFIF